MTSSQGFGSKRRLRKPAEFAAVLKDGQRGNAAGLATAILKTDGISRLGISAPARVGNAVVRNRAKRVIREHFRKNEWTSSAHDIVVTVKPGFVDLSHGDAGTALSEAVGKALRHRAGRDRRPGPRH